MFYLRKCIRQLGVHSCCSFSVKNSSFNCYNGLYCSSITGSQKEDSRIGSSKQIKVLFKSVKKQKIYAIELYTNICREMK